MRIKLFLFDRTGIQRDEKSQIEFQLNRLSDIDFQKTQTKKNWMEKKDISKIPFNDRFKE